MYCSEHGRIEQNCCILILCISSIREKLEFKMTKNEEGGGDEMIQRLMNILLFEASIIYAGQIRH